MVADIRGKKETPVNRDAAFKKAEAADGVEKAKALDEAISIVDAKVAVAFYSDSVDQILELDADGLGEKYAAIYRGVEFEEKLTTLTQRNSMLINSQANWTHSSKTPSQLPEASRHYSRVQTGYSEGKKPAKAL